MSRSFKCQDFIEVCHCFNVSRVLWSQDFPSMGILFFKILIHHFDSRDYRCVRNFRVSRFFKCRNFVFVGISITSGMCRFQLSRFSLH